MRILQLCYSGLGGHGSVVFSLIGADVGRAHEWSVVFVGDSELSQDYALRCQELGVRFVGFRTTPRLQPLAWRKIFNWIKNSEPDAIICHSVSSVLPVKLNSYISGIPLIIVEHTPNQVKTSRERFASTLSALLADQVVCLTPEYLKELQAQKFYRINKNKSIIIPNGIDIEKFQPTRRMYRNEQKKIRLGMAARFSPTKRQELLIHALEELQDIDDQLDYELSLAGDGTEIDAAKRVASASRVSKRILFEGVLSEDQVATWMRSIDIYVHATEGETLSTSLLQAMATGLPIVASDVPGVYNLVGHCGHCVANEVSAFASTIHMLSKRPDIMLLLGSRARVQAIQNHSNKDMLRAYIEIIKAHETINARR